MKTADELLAAIDALPPEKQARINSWLATYAIYSAHGKITMPVSHLDAHEGKLSMENFEKKLKEIAL